MDYKTLKEILISTKLGERKTIYIIDKNTEIFIIKPFKVSAQLKNSKRYDPQKNFQIGIKKEGKKEFLPNHLRILIDLDLKIKNNSKKAKKIFNIIEDIYEGKDPEIFREKIQNMFFDGEIENSFTNLCLVQLFMLEQDINYHFGKVQPPRAYLMGYIRMIRLQIEEIDKLLWSSTRHPPRIMFRSKKCLKT